LTDHDEVFPAADEISARKGLDLHAVDRLGIEGPIEIFEGPDLREVRLPDTPLDPSALPLSGLLGDQALDELQMRETFLLCTGKEKIVVRAEFSGLKTGRAVTVL